MVVSKIVVLVAHEPGRFDRAELEGVIEQVVGEHLDRANAMFEIRDGGTHEVTLGSIVYSLEDGAPLMHAPGDEERNPVAGS